jgi:hypothetical protein
LDHLWSVSEILDAPLERYEAATDQVAALTKQVANRAVSPPSAYNLTGALLTAGDFLNYGSYARRSADVEGIRRAALVAVELRENNVSPSDAAAAVRASPLRNPYDEQPLLWDETEHAVIFRGLEQGDRGLHRLYY